MMGVVPRCGERRGRMSALVRLFCPLDDTSTRAIAPAEWLGFLTESGASIAAGRIVPGDVVMRASRDSLARLEAMAETKRAHKASKKEF